MSKCKWFNARFLNVKHNHRNAQRNFLKEMETTQVIIVTKGRKSNQQRYPEIKKVETSVRLVAVSVKITLNVYNTLRDGHGPRAIDGMILWFFPKSFRSSQHFTSQEGHLWKQNTHIPFEHQGRFITGTKGLPLMLKTWDIYRSAGWEEDKEYSHKPRSKSQRWINFQSLLVMVPWWASWLCGEMMCCL